MSRDRCVISHVNSACSATYSVHDSHVISACLFGGGGDTKMIVHSGFYSDIMGGGGKNHDSITIMNGGVVLDTISGGGPAEEISPERRETSICI